MRRDPLGCLRDERRVRGPKCRRERIERRKKTSVRLSVGLESLRCRRRCLLLGEAVDAVVEQKSDHPDVVADCMNPVRRADRAAVSVTHYHEDFQVGAMKLHPGCDWKSAPVQSMETVCLEVVRESARAPDSRDKDRLLGLELFGNQQLLDRGEDRVISTSGTPSRHRAFVIVQRELAIFVVEHWENRAMCHDSSPLFVLTASRIA